MRVRLYHDETIDLRLEEIVSNLTRLAPRFSFSMGKARFSVAEDVIVCPDTYHALDHRIAKESSSDDVVILFTEKPYDNNYFWESEGNKIIVSLFAWDHLTPLPRNNGAVYFVCALLVRDLGIGQSHRRRNTGCINDFWGDKTGVDRGMRAACICETCVKSVESGSAKSVQTLLGDLQTVLDDVSSASRAGQDICDAWSKPTQKGAFDVFMCHSTEDKAVVREMNNRLKAAKIRTWLDEEQLPPGRAWQDLLEEQIEQVKTAGIFVGGSGMGPWQNVEVRAFLQEFVRRECPVIPVILGNCQSVPRLPLFLNQLTWVDFRKQTPDPFERLLWGITGKKPTS